MHPEVTGIATAFPDAHPQGDVADLAVRIWPELAGSRYLGVFANAGIERRHLVEPLAWYEHPHPFAEREARTCAVAVDLGERAAVAALGQAGVEPGEVDALVYVSTTTLRAPNLDVDLVPRLGLRWDVRRIPVFGFASLGGGAGLGLAADLVRAGHRTVLLVASEVNSLTFVPDAPTPEALVTLALFSDAAAGVVVQAADRPDGSEPLVRLVGHHSTLVPDSLDVMGFDATEVGLQWRLAPTVPEVARRHTRSSVEAALGSVGWTLDDLDHTLLHPGGVKVLDAAAEALGLAPDALRWSRRSLAEHGNLSSVSLLSVLRTFLDDDPPAGRGLCTSMGPGFGYEHVLFER